MNSNRKIWNRWPEKFLHACLIHPKETHVLTNICPSLAVSAPQWRSIAIVILWQALFAQNKGGLPSWMFHSKNKPCYCHSSAEKDNLITKKCMQSRRKHWLELINTLAEGFRSILWKEISQGLVRQFSYSLSPAFTKYFESNTIITVGSI